MPYHLDVTLSHYNKGENPLNGTSVNHLTFDTLTAYQLMRAIGDLQTDLVDQADAHEDKTQSACLHDSKINEFEGDWDCDDCGYIHLEPEPHDAHR